VVARNGRASAWPLRHAVAALERMAHRAGGTGGEGDGCGVHVDIPRRLWRDRLRSDVVDSRAFAVAHLAGDDPERALRSTGLELLALVEQDVDLSAIGPDGRDGTPVLWQAALRVPEDASLLQAWLTLERSGIHVASLSRSSCVYKVLGDPSTLTSFARDLRHPLFGTRVAVAHSRYSTNTLPAFERVQPFGRIAHNGEINTIRRLRLELPGLGAQPLPGASDTQDLDLLVAVLLARGLSLAEVLAMLLPPVRPVTPLDRYHRALIGHVAQGPAALLAGSGESLCAAVDRLGLRPLWRMRTPGELWFSSEPGVLNVSELDDEPAPLAPGERVVIDLRRPGARQPSLSTSLAGAARRSRFTRPRPGRPAFAPVEPADHDFTRDDLAMVESMAGTGEEPIGSLGYDGPLAVFEDGATVSDHFKEEVAVVTNPAIDRDREREQFSLRVLAGPRPAPGAPALMWQLDSPLLPSPDGMPWHRLPLSSDVADAAEAAVLGGATLILLDDRLGAVFDPHLALAMVARRLRERRLHRRASVALAAGGLRNLHDIAVALGTGAVAVEPYALWSLAGPARWRRLRAALEKGLEQVLSTMGTHELAGYGPAFASIGLHPEAAREFPCPALLPGSLPTNRPGAADRPRQVFRMAPKLWKAAGAVAEGRGDYVSFSDQATVVEREHPVALRHLLDLRTRPARDPESVDLRVGDHALPFVISAMSFGSQGESAFRAYLAAATRLDIIAMNGEGGELPELIGWSPRNRAQQVASGRFGVNARMLASCRMIEIKIGQGAKPGEGGHLPGSKVTARVAAARSASPGVDLISPSNNHDLYSIEDLAQIVEELRASNPDVRVGVKVPVVSGIGTIAVGIAKAGADVITLSGYDGGTGAARRHALRHAGLPADLGVVLAHQALCEAGLREGVELWADGGIRTAADVVKLMLLGANRTGFGTMSMVALGCTVCRACQADTCHVGIATQIEDEREAAARGLKRFTPVDAAEGVTRLWRFFDQTAAEVRRLVAGLGASSAQELVGRPDLLVQARGRDRVDLAPMLEPAAPSRPRRPGCRTPALTHALAGRLRAAREQVVQLPAVASGSDRALLTAFAQTVLEPEFDARTAEVDVATGSVAGSGLAAFAPAGLSVRVRGAAQDGTAKGACGARVVVLKAPDADGVLRGGHVGKGFAYGAQDGLLIVQGEADARAGIRLSGADLVIGGEPRWPVRSRPAAAAAQIKGFAFEYMTAGRAVVLGDVGPWAFAGMTGGVVYLRHEPELGLDEAAIRRRFAAAARVALEPLDAAGERDLAELLGAYEDELRRSAQPAQAAEVARLRRDARWCFRAVVPVGMQADQGVSTE